ncbi:fimbria/pilus outer membrane usher protein [Alcaligenes parafaecalis]|uniref:Fimbria/pilus outer membrane usher protein n=1 Tax=Alcaligenes parafaecalis TaxID=171260 RepID=A0ABT3VP71_9BURK|nr:fimbria/pilus outer membrane usher protein [Alcaligenes parafaecalis]MCX5465332.1 fimbria/pilus outer membrane usher protein [Alcaligenes parafaecalis]
MHRNHNTYQNMAYGLAVTLASVFSTGGMAWASDESTAFKLPDTTLYLELVVNGQPRGEILAVPYRQGRYYLPAETLRGLGVSVAGQHTMVAVDQLEGVTVSHDNARQQLLIDLPPEWLPKQWLSQGQRQYEPAKSSTGLLMNYDIYASSRSAYGLRTNRLAAWSEQRLFSPYGILSNTGVWYSGSHRRADRDQTRYLRYDTSWSYSDPDSMRKYVLGDLITDSLAASSSVRMAGVQIGRNFATRPDLVTYPLPVFAGQAALPSTVDLFINNYKMDSYQVNPGPFTVQTLPYINGAGSATVVTRDVLGRELSKEVSFYVSNDLLAPGLTDYSLSAGVMRQRYGLESNRYGQPALSAVVRHGVTPGWTMFAWGEAARDLHNVGVGANAKLGDFGVLTGSWATSKVGDYGRGSAQIRRGLYWLERRPYYGDTFRQEPMEPGQGQQISYGYSYSSSRFSVSIRRTQRSAQYANLGVYRNAATLSRREDVVTGSVALGKGGTLGMAWVDSQDMAGRRIRLVNLSHSISVGNNAFLYTSLNREIGRGVSVQLTLSIPLDDYTNTSASFVRDSEGRRSGQLNYHHSAPASGGLGYSVGVSDGQAQEQYRRADASWSTPQYTVRGGAYGTRRASTGWAQLSGSLIGLGGQVYAANTVHDAFAVVSTSGYPDVPIRYENQYLGKTDSKGYFLIPSMTAWYPTHIQIDPIDLPADVKIPNVESKVAVRAGSGYVVDFKLKKLRAVLLRLHDSNDAALPRGSQVRDELSGATAWVGWDGEVYLENVLDQLNLQAVRGDDGQECRASIPLPPTDGVIRLGVVACQ